LPGNLNTQISLLNTIFMLSTKAVSKQYQEGQFAVENVSLQVQQGEILSLVGESGCGKSTLLRMIAGLIEPDAGEIFFKEEKVKGPAHKLVPGHEQIELVTQDFELFEYLTIFDNIAHFIKIFDKEYRRQRVEELLELCRISRYARKYPRELSGGEQQRVALARALAKEPELLLLDEPFSHLDPHLKKILMEELTLTLRDEGMTAIMVLHDTEDALRLSDHIAMMREGKILQFDEPKVIYEKPVDAYVADLFGDANILPAEVLEGIVENAPKGKTAVVRAENWHLSTENEMSLSGKIHRSFYLGAYYQLEIAVGKKIVKVNSPEDYPKGKKVNLKTDPKKIHWL
jgi:ABC-type Fe3+/spermidine/putrescine transport system ATPase subunit